MHFTQIAHFLFKFLWSLQNAYIAYISLHCYLHPSPSFLLKLMKLYVCMSVGLSLGRWEVPPLHLH